MKRVLLLGVLLIFATACSTSGAVDASKSERTSQERGDHELVASSGCGVERWSVKTGTDADRALVSSAPMARTIQYLRTRTKPTSYPRNQRIAPHELRTYDVGAVVTTYRVEGDKDIHLVLRDGAG